jgi:hypothetical protein
VALLLVGFLLPSPTASPVAEGAVFGSTRPDDLSDASIAAGRDQYVDVGRDSLPRSAPVQLDIPRIGLHTAVIRLGLNADGTVMVPPADPEAPAGWYRHLASPGEPGPAILLGHVDSYQGPAVFHRLAELVAGDRITIDRTDGRTVEFTVQSVKTYPKHSFPTASVYGWTVGPVLRLITCGGSFDRVHRTYVSNVVVFAALTS